MSCVYMGFYIELSTGLGGAEKGGMLLSRTDDEGNERERNRMSASASLRNFL